VQNQDIAGDRVGIRKTPRLVVEIRTGLAPQRFAVHRGGQRAGGSGSRALGAVPGLPACRGTRLLKGGSGTHSPKLIRRALQGAICGWRSR